MSRYLKDFFSLKAAIGGAFKFVSISFLVKTLILKPFVSFLSIKRN